MTDNQIERTRTKYIRKIILGLIILFAFPCIVTAVMLLVPRDRTFTYFHMHNNAKYNDIIMFDDSFYLYQYSGRSSHHYCYVDSSVMLPDVSDNESVTLYTHPIGIRMYKTDNSGIWVQFPVIVYEYTER